jgi:hypothetical protein
MHMMTGIADFETAVDDTVGITGKPVPRTETNARLCSTCCWGYIRMAA